MVQWQVEKLPRSTPAKERTGVSQSAVKCGASSWRWPPRRIKGDQPGQLLCPPFWALCYPWSDCLSRTAALAAFYNLLTLASGLLNLTLANPSQPYAGALVGPTVSFPNTEEGFTLFRAKRCAR